MSGRTISGQGKGRPPWRSGWRSILRQAEIDQEQQGITQSAPPASAGGASERPPSPQEAPAARPGIRLEPLGAHPGRWAVLVRRWQAQQPEERMLLWRVLQLKKPLGHVGIRQQVPRLRLVFRPDLPQHADRRTLPVALRLPALHALLSFVFLALLPQRPLSIPTALGLASAVIVYIQMLAYGGGHGMRE